MVKISKFFAYVIFFILALMYFAPKGSLYYFLEDELQEYGVVISKEELESSMFNLRVKDASLSVRAVESAKIAKADLQIYGLYNRIKLRGIILSRVANSLLPLNIQKATIIHSVLNPLNIQLKAFGELGQVEGEYNIVDRALHLRLKPSDKMLKDYKSTLKNLKKSKSGEYLYDKNI